jgi:hypothetical protein
MWNFSVVVMLVTDPGDSVVYRLGKSKGYSRTPTSGGGPILADAVIAAALGISHFNSGGYYGISYDF